LQRRGGLGAGAVTIVLVPFNNENRALTRVNRDLVPSLRYYRGWSFELIVVDNSERRLERLAECVNALPWPSRYLWQEGANLMYGPSLNLAAKLAEHPILLYVCTNHGRMVHPRWIQDLVDPLRTRERVAMSGHTYSSPPASAVGLAYEPKQLHVQGGVFAARTEVLRNCPYDETRFAHWSSDIWMSYRLLQEGFELADVRSVMSVWRRRARRGPWRYIHDDSE
jgi:hypothetical protein